MTMAGVALALRCRLEKTEDIGGVVFCLINNTIPVTTMWCPPSYEQRLVRAAAMALILPEKIYYREFTYVS